MALRFGDRHPMSAAMTPTLLKALNQNGAAMPSPAAMTPPKAGPTRPADIDSDAVRGNRARQIRFGYELRNDRLPRGGRHARMLR